MENPLSRVRLISVWTLAVLSLGILLLTREIQAHSLIAAAILVPLALLAETRQPLRKTVWLQNAVVLALFAASALRFFAAETPFLLIVADFLIFFMLLKLLFEKGEDDLMQIIALSFFLLLSASTLALDFSFLIGFALYIVGATWTMTLHTLAGQSAAGSEAKNNTDSADLRDLYRFARRNAAITLGLVAIFSAGIFIFFPRLSLAVFQGAFLNPAHESGYADTVNLRKAGNIRESAALVMRVEIPTEQRKNIAAGYLRGHTLASFNGQGWSALPAQQQEGRKPFIQKIVKNYFPVGGPAKELLSKDFGMAVTTQSYVRQDIYLESIGHSTLFGLPWIDTIEAKLPQILIGEDGSVRRPEQTKGRFHYSVKSLMQQPDEATLVRRSREAQTAREAKAETQAEMEPYLELPEMDQNALQSLLGQIVSRRDSPYAKARKIEQYLRRNYAYNLTVRPQNMDQPVESFLFTDKQGTCEYFASAMAVLLRAEKIPSRIVNGFLMRDWNDKGKYFVVRAKDAHSWVEAEMGGIWVPFDPSPIVQGAEAEFSIWNEAKERIEYWNFLWTAYVLGYDMESQKAIAKNVELKSTAFSAQFEKFSGSWRERFWQRRGKTKGDDSDHSGNSPADAGRPGTALILGLAAAILPLLFLGFWTLKRWLKKRGLVTGKGGPGNFYFEMLRLFERQGWAKKSHETPLEFYGRLEREKSEFRDLKASAGKIHGLFYRVRYGEQNPDETSLRDVENELRDLKKRLEKIRR